MFDSDPYCIHGIGILHYFVVFITFSSGKKYEILLIIRKEFKKPDNN